MKKPIEQAQDRFIDLGSRLCELFAISEGTGRILGYLYLSPEPVSLNSICAKLNLSKGTVSVYLRLLEDRMLIKHAWVQGGGREKYYEINPRLWEDLKETMIRKVRLRVELLEKTLSETRLILNSDVKSKRESELKSLDVLFPRLDALEEINIQTGTILDRLFHSLEISREPAALKKVSLNQSRPGKPRK